MEIGYQRQAIAEWRDRQMVEAARMLNLKALEAREAFDSDLRDATARDSIFPTTLATRKIDALLAAALEDDLKRYLSVAAAELAAINESLRPLSQAFAEATVEFPNSSPASELETEVEVAEPLVESAITQPPPPQSAWLLTALPGQIKRQAAALAVHANAAADHIVNDKLHMVDRLREAAVKRIDRAWMGDARPPHPSVLFQLLSLVDETASASRISLT